ncbi:MAG TPA: glycogen-binding domain-containing protein [Verrucomicrobiae bacterium]|nr:glycogen-binding domain-containing protein [Verrucomicrobiae bacterium]
MRKKNNSHKRPNNGAKPIQIEFNHSLASVVAIAGSFNGWQPEAAQLIAKGKWVKELILPPGRYEYLFVADGKWIPDPLAKEGIPNPFGGMNSLLTVTE